MIKIYNFSEFKKLELNIPDFYFLPEYGKLCEITENGIWKCIIFNNNEILLPFIETEIEISNEKIKHIVSNYGYGGIFINKDDNITLFINELIIFMKENNYVTHFLRFTPYFKNNTAVEISYIPETKLYLKSNTYGISFKNETYDNYKKNTKKGHRRSLRKANTNLFFNIRPFEKSDIKGTFQEIYEETMKRVNSEEYYYFNQKYYENMYKYCNNNVYIAEVSLIHTKEVIASAIIFHWNNKYLHYHLGGSKTKYLNLCPNNFLHDGVIQFGFQNNYELYHIGGGVKYGDSLDMFKKSFSNIEFLYYQAKIVYDNEKYQKYKKICKNYNKNFFPEYINN